MTTGDKVYTAITITQTSERKPAAFVYEATVIDGENRILKLKSGQVIVLSEWSNETVHGTEAEAWSDCAARLAAAAATIEKEAQLCETRAAKAAAAAAVGEAVPS